MKVTLNILMVGILLLAVVPVMAANDAHFTHTPELNTQDTVNPVITKSLTDSKDFPALKNVAETLSPMTDTQLAKVEGSYIRHLILFRPWFCFYTGCQAEPVPGVIR